MRGEVMEKSNEGKKHEKKDEMKAGHKNEGIKEEKKGRKETDKKREERK